MKLILLSLLFSSSVLAKTQPEFEPEKLPTLIVQKVCIEGQVHYWYKDWTTAFGDRGYAALTVQLNDDGKPVKCEVKKVAK
jgi:hypothetical protein